MTLGITVHYTVGVANLATVLPFYQQLGFTELERSAEPFPWAVLSDGQIVVALRQDGLIYRGLTYFAPDMVERVAGLEARGILFSMKERSPAGVFQAIFIAADGVPVGLIEYADAAPPELEHPNQRLGNFGELALGIADLDASVATWTHLGFEVMFRDDNPDHPWAILVDGLLTLGLHQTSDFDGPALTYFAMDMERRLRRLVEEGVTLTQPMPDEAGAVRNAIVEAPDGQLFFLFEGDVDNPPA